MKKNLPFVLGLHYVYFVSFLIDQINKNPFVLAPMAGITDKAFRSFMKSMGASVVVTELVSANGLKYQNERTKRIMEFNEDQYPIGIQIFGETLDSLDFAARECEQMGASFVDLNFGCPVNKIVKKGAGSAVLKDLNFLKDILRTVKSAVSIPVTIKIRTGWNADTKNSEEVCQVAYDEGMEWVAIHGRTRAQAYNGSADWDYIKWVKKNSPLPVLGNGDLTSPEKSCEMLSYSGCDGVMIGRGCLKNPWIFKESLDLLNKNQVKSKRDHLELLKILISFYQETVEERILMLQLKKFSSWFSTGYPGSANFRKELFRAKEKNEVFDKIFTYFEGLRTYQQEDTSKENFLMGGHG